MVKFSLLCDQDHVFEAWFQSNESFESQKQAGHICCPDCASVSVRKALMAPNLSTPKTKARIKSQDDNQTIGQENSQNGEAASTVPAAIPAGAKPVLHSAEPSDAHPLKAQSSDAHSSHGGRPNMQQMAQIVRKMHQLVSENCTNVGPQFATEARKMHEGEIDAKPIYGTSTAKEREELAEEGIAFAQLPDLPKDH